MSEKHAKLWARLVNAAERFGWSNDTLCEMAIRWRVVVGY